MKKSINIIVTLLVALAVQAAWAAEFHVSVKGNDASDGSMAKPFKTISVAARVAQAGDVITVHEGVYRERVNPPRGGESDAKRIVYQAGAGEKVEIRGSEVVKNWVKEEKGRGDVWRVVIPNAFFGAFNPYSDVIRGDWFNGRGREHHTGAVYLNGEWLIEAAKLEEVMLPAGVSPAWLNRGGGQYLLNVAWLKPEGAGSRIGATAFAAKNGTQNAPCSEGGECIGFIEQGHWVKYEKVDFGAGTEQLEIRAASAAEGGIIEIRLDGPEGEVLGKCGVPNTGGWQTWLSYRPKIKATSGVKTICLVFKAQPAKGDALDAPLWFAQVDKENTTIWAQFPGVNPNEQLVEINVRRAVFYPDKPGRNYITVRGFAMRHAATPWAPPTAEQIGLIGTHWSKGWIIENNVVSHSTCSGIALGKHGDEFDNTSANSAEGYVKTIERGLARGWHKDNIGGHIVRNNTVSHCEQAGIVGSLGPIFCLVTGNTIHDIHVRRLFTGAEMAGIKFHGAIDTEISHNHIYRTCRGLWLDWMAQGTRVTANLFHDNAAEDLFVEVNHGPFLVDNNIFLSPTTLLDMSEGGAYAHNLMAGRLVPRQELRRDTPFHPAHSTAVAGLKNILGGDDRFYNNIFAGGSGLAEYDKAKQSVYMGGNMFFKEAKPSAHESDAVMKQADPAVKLVERADGFYLEMTFDKSGGKDRKLVTTELLGKAKVPNLPYENPDGSPLIVDTDYFGAKRNVSAPTAGPFENPRQGELELKVW